MKVLQHWGKFTQPSRNFLYMSDMLITWCEIIWLLTTVILFNVALLELKWSSPYDQSGPSVANAAAATEKVLQTLLLVEENLGDMNPINMRLSCVNATQWICSGCKEMHRLDAQCSSCSHPISESVVGAQICFSRHTKQQILETTFLNGLFQTSKLSCCISTHINFQKLGTESRQLLMD